MFRILFLLTLISVPALAQSPAHLYSSGNGDPEAKYYVALYLYFRECEKAASLLNAAQDGVRFWCEEVE